MVADLDLKTEQVFNFPFSGFRDSEHAFLLHVGTCPFIRLFFKSGERPRFFVSQALAVVVHPLQVWWFSLHG